jgi:hypothetical protein
MRGLDPRIHRLRKEVDCRVKPGNDEPEDWSEKPECPPN